MSSPGVLAIDAGTGSVRAILFDAGFRQLGAASREYTHPAVAGHPGGQDFDTERNWGLIAECVREVIATVGASADQVVAVSATSMREGLVLYDDRGREIWACPNSDSRAPRESRELIEEGSADRIYELAGDWIAITAPPRLRWIRRHEPEIFAGTRQMTMLSDWILFRLSGEFATDPTIGSSSAMFDLERRTWSDEIASICGLDSSNLPPVVEPGTPVGVVSAQAASETGLREGTPVVVGGADTQLGILGLGTAAPGACTVLGGTFWQTTMLLDEPTVDPRRRLRTLCHVHPRSWMVEGIGFWCGLVLRWLRDAFFEAEKREAEQRGPDAYASMEALAAGVPPGSNGLVGIFSDLMNAAGWVHAAPSFLGFDVTAPERSGRAQCVRAVQEGAAYVTRGHLKMLEELTGRRPEGITFTGGASKGELWRQIVADVTARPVTIPTVRESTALGAAVCAAAGAGLFDGVRSAADALPQSELTIAPEQTAVAAYDELYPRWRHLYRHAREAVDRDLVEPMWRAAGA